ncbi:6338_t:CDS:2, partial [Cetraspora pellucida]
NTLFDSCGISDFSKESFMTDKVQASFSIMDTIQNLRINDLNNNSALASEFNLTHIAAILRSLIQQVEQAN